MSNPYFRVTISAKVRLHPKDMNNNIIENIKKAAERKYNNRCFLNYGYIDSIYNIVGNPRGVIKNEDPTSSGLYNVDMECRMLVPIPGEEIYATVVGIIDEMCIANTGHLRISISKQYINESNIKFTRNAYYQIDQNGKPFGKPIDKGTFVVIKLLACRIVPNNQNIIGFGTLEYVVSEKDFDKVHTDHKEKNITQNEIMKIRNNNFNGKIEQNEKNEKNEQNEQNNDDESSSIVIETSTDNSTDNE